MAPKRSLHRPLLGAAAAASYVLGVIVLPVLHLAYHAVPHDHEGGGIHVHLASPDAPHVHPHRHEDAEALRRASGAPLVAPLAGPSLAAREAHPHEASGLAHFATAPGEGGEAGTVPPIQLVFDRVPDVLGNRLIPDFLEGGDPPRGPPAA